MDGNGTGDIWGTTVRNKRVFFQDEVASSKLNLHEMGHFLGSKVTLVCLRQSTRVSSMG